MTDPPRQYTLASPDADPPITWGYWVVKGQFLAGAYPGSLDPEEHRLKVQTLVDAGIRTFINLTETNERGLGARSPHRGRRLCPALRRDRQRIEALEAAQGIYEKMSEAE